MYDPLFVHLLDTAHHLHTDQQDCLQIELAFAGLEEILKGRAQEVHDHHVEVLVRDRAVRADVVQARDAC